MAEKSRNVTAHRLLIGFSTIILLLIAFGVISLIEIRTLSKITRTIYNHPLVVSNASLRATVSMIKMHRSMKDVALFEFPSGINTAIKAVNEQEGMVLKSLDIVKENILGDEGQKLENETRRLFVTWNPIRETVINMVFNGQREEAAKITMGKGADHVAKLENKMLELTSYARNKVDGLMRHGEKVRLRVMNTTIILISIGLLLSVFIASLTIRRTQSAEKALLESEEQYRILIEAASQSGQAITMQQDRDGIEAVCIFANDAAVGLTGYTRDELSKMSWMEIVHPLYRDEAADRYRKRMNEEKVAELIPIRIIRKNGTEITIELTSILTMFRGLKTLVTLSRDITERMQAEEAIRRSKILLESSIESPKDMIILSLDREYRYLYFNKTHAESMRHVYGTRPQIGDCIFDHMKSKADIEKVKQQYDRALAGEGHVAIEEYGEDQVRYYYEIRYNPVYDEKNEIIGVTAFAQDITERKQVEEELRRKTGLNQMLLDALPCVALLLKPSTREIVASNEAGRNAGAVPGKTCYGTWGQRTNPCPWCLAPKLWEKGEPQHQELDAVNVYWDAHWYPIDDDLYLHYAFDITEKKKMETQLQQSQKMEAIGTLAGGIAHDFNNILSPIMIHSEMMMLDLPDDSPFQNNLRQLFQASQRARDLVKQILTFSRQTPQEPKPFKMSIIVKEVLKLLSSSLPSTIRIDQDIDMETDTVFADPTQIHQVLMNLCTNAGHAMREEGGNLSVALIETMADSDVIARCPDLIIDRSYLQLTVADTGHGMEPAIIERIFEPYFSTKQKGEGTGMGLSVVHGIVQNHGGAISVKSEPGKGTTFNVFLPKIETDVAEDMETIQTLPKGSERVLYVDDEKSMVDSVGPMLESLGYQVTARTSSIEALEAFRSKPDAFDLVITDMTMPEMTGDKLAKAIMETRSDIPVILCTGYSDRISETTARGMGIKAFVLKPIVMREIANTIREVLGD